jgi:4-amino-4-deoxy-L-arabinose transferase-like glycosyltransferase
VPVVIAGRYGAWFAGATPLTARQRRWLVAILVLATALRLAWAIYAAHTPRGIHDPSLYDLYGVRIAQGHGYTLPIGPTAYYPPGYPISLGILYWIMFHTPIPDHTPIMIAGSNLVYGVLTVLLVFELARRLFDNRTGLVAALLVAVYPNLVFHTAVALTETLFILLFIALLLVLVSARWDGEGDGVSRGRLVAAGVLLGLSALVRPISFLLLPALVVVWLVAGWGWRRSLARAALLAVVAIALIVPWTIRNAIVMNAFVPISTNAGDDLCMSRQPGATGGFYLTDYCFGAYDGVPRPEYETLRDAYTLRRAAAFVRDHPGREVVLWFLRMQKTMRNDHDGLRASESYDTDQFIDPTLRSVLAKTADFYFFATILGTIVALPRVLRGRDPKRLLFALTIVALLLPPVIFFGDPRFHVPALPFFAIGTAVALAYRGAPARRVDTQSNSTTDVTAAAIA